MRAGAAARPNGAASPRLPAPTRSRWPTTRSRRSPPTSSPRSRTAPIWKPSTRIATRCSTASSPIGRSSETAITACRTDPASGWSWIGRRSRNTACREGKAGGALPHPLNRRRLAFAVMPFQPRYIRRQPLDLVVVAHADLAGESAFGDDEGTVGGFVDFQHLGAEHDHRVPLRDVVVEEAIDLALAADVDPARRLLEEEQARPAMERL